MTEVKAFARVEHDRRTYDVTIFANGQATVRQLMKSGVRRLDPKTNAQKTRFLAIVAKAVREIA